MRRLSQIGDNFRRVMLMIQVVQDAIILLKRAEQNGHNGPCAAGKSYNKQFYEGVYAHRWDSIRTLMK